MYHQIYNDERVKHNDSDNVLGLVTLPNKEYVEEEKHTGDTSSAISLCAESSDSRKITKFSKKNALKSEDGSFYCPNPLCGKISNCELHDVIHIF